MNKCEYCDYESIHNEIYVDPLDGRYYLDVQTGEWSEYYDDYVYVRVYINYCPYCGRKLDNKA